MKDSLDAAMSPYELQPDAQYLNFEKVEVTEVDETKPWKPAKRVRVTMEGGASTEIDAKTPFFTFRNGAGNELTVSAEAAGHIDALHIKGQDAGSLFDEPSLEALMRDVSGKIPSGVASEPGVSAFAVEMGKKMGREGVASLEELVADGVLAREDVDAALVLKDEVKQLNLQGTKEQKDAFIAAHSNGKVKFQLIRGEVLVPFVDAPKRETTQLFMVFGPAEGDPRKTMYTAAPGRYMPRHPNPNQHKGADGVVDAKTFEESADAWFETVMLSGK